MHSWSPCGHVTFRLFFHSSVCTPTRSLSPSFVLSFVRLFVRSFFRSVCRSVVRSFVPWFFRRFVRCFFRSFVRSSVPSFVRWFVGSVLLSVGRSVGSRSFVPLFGRFIHFVYLILESLIKYCGCDDGINSGENFFFFSFLYFMSDVIIPISCK